MSARQPGLTVNATATGGFSILFNDHYVKETALLGKANTFPLSAGLTLAYDTATATYVPYDDTVTGNNTAKYILLETLIAETDSAGSKVDVYGDVTRHAFIRSASCIGLDANAQTDLKNIIFV